MSADPQDDETGSARIRRDRRRLWAGLAGLGALCLIVAGVVIYSDAAPPDLSDLTFEPVEVADADNLYLALLRRSSALKTTPIIAEDASDAENVVRLAEVEAANAAPGPGTREELAPLRERLLDGREWTPTRLEGWGPALDALAGEFAGLLKLPAAQVTSVVPSASGLGGSSRVWEIRELAQHIRLAAWARYHAGRQTEAVRTALDGLDAGLRLADARGQLIEYLTALSIQGMFLDVLADIAARPDARPDTLREIAVGLKQWPPGRDGYAHVLRNEARFMMAQYRWLAADEVSGWSGGHWTPRVGPVSGIARTRVLFPLVYKRNLTIALQADVVRTELAVFDLPKAERPPRSADAFGGEIEAGDLVRPANVLGRFLVELDANTYEGTALTRHLAFSRRALVEATVALRLYYLAHRTLPERLDDLVPEYLAAVPVDYVDRQPLRYSREYRVLWSVGRKGLMVTSGNPPIGDREVIALLDFAKPPENSPAGESP